MAKSLRTFLDQVKETRPDELKTIRREVDPELELAAVVEKYQRRNEFPGLLFEKVKGSKLPVLINLHASFDRMALAMGAKDILDMEKSQAQQEANPLDPKWVEHSQAPVQQVVLQGQDVDLELLPLTHKNELDAGRYISAGVSIMKERGGGRINMGIYRHQLQGRDQLGFMVNPANHGSHIQRDYEDHNEPCPIAIVIGHHPCFYMAGVSKVAYGEEIRLAGALMGEPLEVVKGCTVDLPIPAQAEIVIEGYLPPNERHDEGPFGEWPGYYYMQGPRPFIKVTAITMRKDAICQDLLNAHPEHTILGAVPRMGSLYRAIKAVTPNLVAVNLPWSGNCRSFCYISIKKRSEGEATQAAFAAMTTEPNIRHTWIVDDDVDVFSDQEVLTAMATRFQADRQMKVIPNAIGAHLNPTAYGFDRMTQGPMETKVIFDCTKPLPPYPFAEKARAKPELVEAIELSEYE